MSNIKLKRLALPAILGLPRSNPRHLRPEEFSSHPASDRRIEQYSHPCALTPPISRKSIAIIALVPPHRCKFLKLSLTRQALILISVPLCFEIACVGMLVYTQREADIEAARATKARKIADCITRLNNEVL